jgi:peptidoglycan/LPS O-acetylase OafA/YrhL
MNNDKPSLDRIPALDGVRGVAILLVFSHHVAELFTVSNIPLQWIQEVAFSGWTGVDLFFVLSGFLITGILWDTRTGAAYFRNFYARRTIRIFPLYYATLAVLFIVVPAIRHFWLWYCAYFVDVLNAWQGRFVFAAHFWTLAVEEHFYLLWPILVYKLARRTLISTSLFLTVAALVLRLAMTLGGATPMAIYVLTPCRMDGLALGAFLALTLRGPNGLQTLVRLARVVLPISAAAWIAIMCVKGRWSQYGLIPQTAGYLVSEMFYGSVLVFALASSRLAAIMSARPLRFIGKISYALYVFHVFIIAWAAQFFALGATADYSIVFSLAAHLMAGRPLPVTLLLWLDALAYIVLASGLCVGAALLSWHLLELPCLRLRRLFPYARKDAAGRPSETQPRATMGLVERPGDLAG